MVSSAVAVVLVLFFELIITGFFLLYYFSYNIPVTILRFTGNKERPMLVHAKAKKVVNHGVPRLFVKGYKEPFRDYLSENYFPTPRGKWGGLVLWEFEDGLLTPTIPLKVDRKLSKEQREELTKAFQKVSSLGKVDFEFDKLLHEQLKLKAIDDVDVEFMLQDHARIEAQYQGNGFKDFLMKYGSHMTIVIIACLMLAGVTIWFERMPEFANACYGMAKQGLESSLLEQASDKLAPKG